MTGRQSDSEELDGNSGVGFWINRAEYRSTRAGSELVQDTEAADRRGWDVEQRAFPGHVLTRDIITRS
ncbi:MAG: hypothetical protein R2712_06865 [Vicinamibacterales bacterium]